MTPLARSLRWLKENGYTAQKVEHWNSWAKRRVDLFGFVDILAMREDERGVTAIQVTTRSNASKRESKLRGIGAVWLFLRCGNRIYIHAWAKCGARGKRKTWQLKVTQFGKSK